MHNLTYTYASLFFMYSSTSSASKTEALLLLKVVGRF
uniref:Uncharacterized protein n=1 Tax=Arundo donax TaxID=35708 RepID=A0A0A9BAZ2_ARUDO